MSATGHRFHPSLLREYDIRGIFGDTLHSDDAHAIGRSFATRVRRAGGRRVAVGYDGRLSSPALEEALVAGLTESGIDVVRIGLGPTPMLYFAEWSAEEVQGGIHVTGSHNPPDHNGFKIVLSGRPFFGPDIVDLGHIAAAGDWIGGQGVVERDDFAAAYLDRLLRAVEGLGDLGALRIGWDTGNGAAGPMVQALARHLPGYHATLFTEIDGHFPNHHPDPTVEANLAHLRQSVVSERLDFGLAFDGDGDRLGVVDGLGRVLSGDHLLMILAEDMLSRRPGATIIADVKASRHVFERIAQAGGQPLMWKSGHSHIKSKMKETGALLGGEMTGHLFFADDYPGFDDALYASLRLIAAVVRSGRSLAGLHDGLPLTCATPELRFAVDETTKFAAIDAIRARLVNAGATVDTTDGVRVTCADGWWLLRASNTQAMLTARAESDDEAGLARLVAEIDTRLAHCGITRSP